jgi:DNA mismatch endonuclease, patch repair protein
MTGPAAATAGQPQATKPRASPSRTSSTAGSRFALGRRALIRSCFQSRRRSSRPPYSCAHSSSALEAARLPWEYRARPSRIAFLSMSTLPAPPPASSAAARAVMRGNRGSDTKPERALRSELHRRGLRFRKNVSPVPGLRCRADVVFTRARVAVFVDGCYWHRCPQHGTAPRSNSDYWQAKLDRNVARDRQNDAALDTAGWTVVRVWEHENPALAADRVALVVAARPTPGE